mmetsp:Transcript_10132/g.30356  ORF Transcript_10132/g.30356 Transcript_10132/m.30356 type:complete len:255 (+) Transcript_10132:3055-3819(+)
MRLLGCAGGSALCGASGRCGSGGRKGLHALPGEQKDLWLVLGGAGCEGLPPVGMQQAPRGLLEGLPGCQTQICLRPGLLGEGGPALVAVGSRVADVSEAPRCHALQQARQRPPTAALHARRIRLHHYQVWRRCFHHGLKAVQDGVLPAGGADADRHDVSAGGHQCRRRPPAAGARAPAARSRLTRLSGGVTGCKLRIMAALALQTHGMSVHRTRRQSVHRHQLVPPVERQAGLKGLPTWGTGLQGNHAVPPCRC